MSAPSSVSAASWTSATLSDAGESFQRPWHRVWGTWKALEDVAVVDFDVVGLEETASNVVHLRERERESDKANTLSNVKAKSYSSELQQRAYLDPLLYAL